MLTAQPDLELVCGICALASRSVGITSLHCILSVACLQCSFAVSRLQLCGYINSCSLQVHVTNMLGISFQV